MFFFFKRGDFGGTFIEHKQHTGSRDVKTCKLTAAASVKAISLTVNSTNSTAEQCQGGHTYRCLTA